MILGLTGGIACGKTTVSNYLKSKGFKIYDADIIAKEISEQKEVISEIVEKIGNKVLDEKNQKINRQELKKIVFFDKKKLEILNNIIHPRVYKCFEKIRNENFKTDKIEVFDIPLLYESGMEKLCDKILLIVASPEIKKERIIKRDNISEELAEKIIKSQMSDEEKIKKADIIIENNQDIEALLKKVERFCENL